MPDLSVIILNYNTKALLHQCLSSLDPRSVYETIVVDNASRDGSAAMVKKDFPFVHLIKSSKNVGFSRGNNLARKVATGKYILFLNSDTVIEGKAIEKILHYMESDQMVGIATCLVHLVDGSLYYACHRGFPSPWNSFCYFSGLAKIFPKTKLFSGYTLSYLPLDKIHEIDACSGTFLMIRRDLADKFSWFDEDFYFYGEDIDLCYKVKQEGFKVMFNPTCQITHYWGATSGMIEVSKDVAQPSHETKLAAISGRFAAMRLFYDKHYRNVYPAIIRSLVFFAINLKEMLAKRDI